MPMGIGRKNILHYKMVNQLKPSGFRRVILSTAADTRVGPRIRRISVVPRSNLLYPAVYNGQEELRLEPLPLPLPLASTSTGLDWETSAAGTGYGHDIQPNQYLAKSDFFNFDAYNFGTDLSWLDSFVSSDAVPPFSSRNYPPPTLDNAAQFFPATSLPQLHTSLPAPSSFQITPLVDSPVAVSSLNYQPPMLHDASQYFPGTSLPRLPASHPAESSFPIAPAVYAPVVDAHSTVSRKRKIRDETDLADMVQGMRTQKVPKHFDI
ncbi:hypothetical protein C8R45DRAFT_940603 [Mycena sanguinolenta]|nr:hypothetical protein C8R45DRAFT_940603 [Mycena sanguinolenta]